MSLPYRFLNQITHLLVISFPLKRIILATTRVVYLYHKSIWTLTSHSVCFPNMTWISCMCPVHFSWDGNRVDGESDVFKRKEPSLDCVILNSWCLIHRLSLEFRGDSSNSPSVSPSQRVLSKNYPLGLSGIHWFYLLLVNYWETSKYVDLTKRNYLLTENIIDNLVLKW